TIMGNSLILNPVASTRTTYSPGVSAPEAYLPADVVVVVLTWPVPLFVIDTLASPITAPLGSVTVPTMLPVLMVVCAQVNTDAANANVANANKNLAFDET